MPPKAPSSLDVARRAGVSQTTVSFVLNRRSGTSISEETRQRVLEAAKELGYRPNLLARNLVSGKSYTVGVVASRLDSSFTFSLIQGIQETCVSRGYRLLLGPTMFDPEVEAREVELLLQRQVDGLIYIATEHTIAGVRSWLDPVVKHSTPCVIIDDRTFSGEVDCVVSNDQAGAMQAVNHLIAFGHRRVAFLAAGEKVSSARDRRTGYENALRGAGIPVDERLIVGAAFESSEVDKHVGALLSLDDPPTAFFAANDRKAAEAKLSLERRGCRTPEDVALVGYANYEISRYLALTTVNQAPQQIGRAAAERLLERIAAPEISPSLIVLPTSLIIRGSCGAERSGEGLP